MESILLKIRDNYPAMGHSEKHIADWITKNFEEMLGLSSVSWLKNAAAAKQRWSDFQEGSGFRDIRS